ncbi:TonB-dependent receptor [Vandammella animalimorsus]|uniref:TonB-dependent receptor n=1 Tax=Vandammella animalimorsus TaxID=2029117 RepID=UPI0031BAED63
MPPLQPWPPGRVCPSLAAALLTCAALPAAGQAPAAPADAQDAATLPAVTVQARRSAEQARDLPLTVQAVDEVELEERRLNHLEDLLRGTPGVEVNTWGGASDANVRMRGVGSLYQSGPDDTSVVVDVDGVPTSVGNAALGTLDVEQVEVLKGPQGTLFGRNSEAGAIHIRTRRPALGLAGGHVRAEAGSGHQHLAEGAFNLPLGQRAAARLALRHNAQDYDYVNLLSGQPVSRPRDLAWRASLLWQPQPATEVLLRASHHNARRYQSATLLRPYGDNPGQELSSDGLLDGNYRKISQYSLHVQHDFAAARLTSVTSHERTRAFSAYMTGRELSRVALGMDADFPLYDSGGGRTWSQDVRLSSLPGSRVFWVAGLNLYRSDRDNAYESIVRGRQSYDFSDDADALYGEATWPLGERLKLTTGLRHTRERKGYAALYAMPGSSAATPDSRRFREGFTTGRLGLSWALSAQTNLYSTLARGHKSGGFNGNSMQPADSLPYRPGKVSSLELGAKHESADGRLRLSGALFFNRVRDDHLITIDMSTYAYMLANADTRSRGLELQADWRAGGGLTLSGGLALVDGEIQTNVITNTEAGDVRAGNRLPDVPRLSALLGVQWQRALPAFWGLHSPVLNTRLTLRHVGKRAADAQNNFDLGSYNKVDLRLGVISGNTELYLWGDNLLNERYDLYGHHIAPGLSAGMPARGRSFGIGLTHQF